MSAEPALLRRRVILAATAALLLGGARLAAEPATVLFLNGRVHAMDAADTHATAVAIAGERIVYVGDDSGARRLAGPGTRTIDLAGRNLLPGFQDSHVHPGLAPDPATRLDLGGLGDREAILARIAAHARSHPARPWIVGTGWEESAFLPAGQPTRQMLDAVVADRPAFLSNNSQHMAWVNTAALHAAGIDAKTPDPPNGRIERDDQGEATGVLQEAAMDLVRAVMPPAPVAEQAAGLLAAMRTMHRSGITAYQDALVRPAAVPAYLALARDPAFAIRARLCLWFDPSADDAVQIARLLEWRAQFGSATVRADCVKIVLDGAYGSHTVALLEPYEDEPARFGRGALFVEPARLERVVTQLEAEGFRIHVHAIGDRAVRTALDAFAAARRANGVRDARHAIAHVGLVDAADMPRFAALGVVANMSPLWSRGDPWETVFAPRLFGTERTARLYPARALLDAGATLVWGSDWPVTELDPLAGIETAVTHRYPGGRDPEGKPDTAWNPDQRVSLGEALRAYTATGAWHVHDEAGRGTVVPGALADLVVTGRDLYASEPLAIHAAGVDFTVVGGAIVFEREAAALPRAVDLP